MIGCLVGLLTAALALPVSAQEVEASASGSLKIGGQLTSVDGNESSFREDSLGQRDGVLLDLFQYRQHRPSSDLSLNARFTTGGSGWLDLDVTGDRWRSGFRVTRVNRWSSNSFAADYLPSGTPVSSLVPGTTELDPLFGTSYPNEDLIRGEAYLTRRFTGADRITFRAGSSSLNGNRVPSIGGFSFSDVGTPAFYTAGQQTDSSSSWWAALDGRFHLGGVLFRTSAGTMHRKDDRSYRMPAYGQDGLIDLNQWRNGLDVDTWWVRLDGSWRGEAWAARGGVAYVDTSNDPSGGDAEVEADGTVRRPGLEIGGGTVTLKSFSGALGVSWHVARPVTLSLSVDALHRYGNGDVDLLLRAKPFVPATSSRDDTRVGGTFIANLGFSGASLRLRLRGESSNADLRQSREPYSEDLTRSTDRFDARIDGCVRFGEGWSLRGWARYRKDGVDVDLVDLREGYTPGDWQRQDTSGMVALRYRSGALTVGLNGLSSLSSYDSDLPYFDPIFDPSLQLFPVSSSQRLNRIWGNLLWAFERGSLWLEGGWLQAKFGFPTGGLAGYAPLSEKTSGTVIALGGDVAAWRGGILSGQVESVDGGDQKDASIFRGWLELEQAVAKTMKLFARWGYWDLSDALAPSRELTATVFTAGVHMSF
ncbi:MAG: TonB-dependent receptor [Acidobacteria bacterium]|nr:TonB-dependent receptor [Acidobacteriota bacterium]